MEFFKIEAIFNTGCVPETRHFPQNITSFICKVKNMFASRSASENGTCWALLRSAVEMVTKPSQTIEEEMKLEGLRIR